MQAIQAGQTGSVRLIGGGGGIFTAISASTMINACHQRTAATFPNEGFRRSLLLAFGTLGEIERLDMSLQTLVSFAGGCQFSQGCP